MKHYSAAMKRWDGVTLNNLDCDICNQKCHDTTKFLSFDICLDCIDLVIEVGKECVEYYKLKYPNCAPKDIIHLPGYGERLLRIIAERRLRYGL